MKNLTQLMINGRDRNYKTKQTKISNALNEQISDLRKEIGPEVKEQKCDNFLNETLEKSGKLLTKHNRKAKSIRERAEITARAEELLSESIAKIVVNATPIDNDVKEIKFDILKENVKIQLKKLFENKMLRLYDFTNNKSETVKTFAIDILNEENTDDDKEIEKLTVDTVKKKVTKNIKDEITATKKHEKEKEELEKELSESAEIANPIVANSIINFSKGKKRLKHNEFHKFYMASAKEYINENKELNPEIAIGDAAVRYTLVETLNVLYLLNDNNKNKVINFVCS